MKKKLISLFCVSAILGCVAFVHGKADAALSETGEYGVTVSAGWLRKHIDDKNLVLLHIGLKNELEAG